MPRKVLYISYDGMTDTLGQSQVIPYLQGLSAKGYKITLLSFEKKEKLAKLSGHIQSILDKAGIEWVPKLFTRTPPLLSKIYDVWKLKRAAVKLYKERKFDLIHCRSYVAAEAGLLLTRKFGVPFLFDMRGFWVDERVDNGQWNLDNPIYKYFYRSYKKKEKTYLQESGHIISLTSKGKDELVNVYNVPAEKVTVIPCCVALDHFDYRKVTDKSIDDKKRELGINPGDTIVSYLGSLGGWYLVKEMIDFFSAMKKEIPAARFLFITQDPPAMIYEAAAQSNVDKESVIVRPASRNEVPLFLSLSNYCIFFIKDAYSKRASSPTKQGEIMAMGLPLICNDIGDTGRIVEATRAGLLVKKFDEANYHEAIKQLGNLANLKKEDIRSAAHEYYDLENGITRYWEVYKKLCG